MTSKQVKGIYENELNIALSRSTADEAEAAAALKRYTLKQLKEMYSTISTVEAKGKKVEIIKLMKNHFDNEARIENMNKVFIRR